MEYCKDNVPKWNPISVSGYHIREAGSTAVQELSFMLADAIEYLEIAKSRNIDIEKICQRVSFFLQYIIIFLRRLQNIELQEGFGQIF